MIQKHNKFLTFYYYSYGCNFLLPRVIKNGLRKFNFLALLITQIWLSFWGTAPWTEKEESNGCWCTSSCPTGAWRITSSIKVYHHYLGKQDWRLCLVLLKDWLISMKDSKFRYFKSLILSKF